MTSFATADDLATLLKRTFTTAERAQAELMLTGAEAYVRSVADQWISEVVGDVITVDAPHSDVLWLPQRPVTSVTVVKVDSVVITDWRLRGSRLIRECPWASPCDDHEVEITYTHGHGIESDGIELARSASLTLAAQEMSNPGNLLSHSIDDYTEVYRAKTGDSASGLGFLGKAIARTYGKRPRTGSVNTA